VLLAVVGLLDVHEPDVVHVAEQPLAGALLADVGGEHGDLAADPVGLRGLLRVADEDDAEPERAELRDPSLNSSVIASQPLPYSKSEAWTNPGRGLAGAAREPVDDVLGAHALERVDGVDDDELVVVVAGGELGADLAELFPRAARLDERVDAVVAGLGRDEQGVVVVDRGGRRRLADLGAADEDGGEPVDAERRLLVFSVGSGIRRPLAFGGSVGGFRPARSPRLQPRAVALVATFCQWIASRNSHASWCDVGGSMPMNHEPSRSSTPLLEASIASGASLPVVPRFGRRVAPNAHEPASPRCHAASSSSSSSWAGRVW
jgi:hypothetical protein